MAAADSRLTITLKREEARLLRAVLVKLVPPPPAEPSRKLVELAERMQLVFRDARNLLPDDVAGESGCEMLFLLYCAAVRGEEVTVSSLGSSMGLPHATAARRIAAFSGLGLIAIAKDARDRRRRFVTLTKPAFETVTAWLETISP